jgi:hypothetical protein
VGNLEAFSRAMGDVEEVLVGRRRLGVGDLNPLPATLKKKILLPSESKLRAVERAAFSIRS